MSDSPIPQKYKVLSGSALKVIATLTMFIDHTAHALMQHNPIVLFQLYDKTISVYYIMRAVGRIAFPIFVFLLVEGFLHTRSRKQYALRLFVFAAVSEIPWNLEHTGKIFIPETQSVFVSLFFALLALCALDHLLHGEEAQRPKWAAALIGVFFCPGIYTLRLRHACHGLGHSHLHYERTAGCTGGAGKQHTLWSIDYELAISAVYNLGVCSHKHVQRQARLYSRPCATAALLRHISRAHAAALLHKAYNHRLLAAFTRGGMSHVP